MCVREFDTVIGTFSIVSWKLTAHSTIVEITLKIFVYYACGRLSSTFILNFSYAAIIIFYIG